MLLLTLVGPQGSNDEDADSSVMETDQDCAESNSQTKTCFFLFSKFAKEVKSSYAPV